ncbi:DEAD/DEAH box helicase [Streptomyces sp. NPDC017448]|uniref:DEAD/DEAH box helicase n=1 Tax=Streptomyces sp. NPDC017448 TaxID=3364996 RepID=UPI0037A31140
MFVGELRPYQDEAVDRMVERGSLLLAYGQGLGKTVVTIAATEELMGEGEVTTTLIVALSSLKLQWAQALATFTDVRTRWIKVKDQHIRVPAEDQCVMLDGSPEKRAKLYRQIRETQPEYIIATYDNVIDDWAQIRQLDVQCIVVDEATQVKGFKAERSKKLKRMWAPFRFALTGTPIENGKPEEVFSIMEWVDPDVFGRWDTFDETYVERNHFGGVVRYKNMNEFHATLSTAMIRKTPEDPEVAPFMPKVAFSERKVQMDFPTRRAYRRIAQDLAEELEAAGKRKGTFDLAAYYAGSKQPDEKSAQGKIMARMLAAQMLLDHPDLLRKSAQDFEESERARQEGARKATWPGSKYAYEAVEAGYLNGVHTTPKLDAVIQEIQEILEQDPAHKVIVFSFFRGMGHLLQEALPEYGSVVFHGQLTQTGKAAAKSKFTQSASCRLFLASDAGGYGLDLPEASHLINVDYAVSAGAQDQRNTRHRRTSSTWKTIYVIDFLMEGTLEERKREQLGLKRRVASAALDRKGASASGEIDNNVETLGAHLGKHLNRAAA